MPTRLPRTILTVLTLVLFGVSMYIFWQNETLRSSLNTPTQSKFSVSSTLTQEETSRIISNLQSIYLIDTEEQPVLATIIDAQKTRESNPEFYINAKDGDVLVAYKTRAIIYRPTQNQVINSAPVVKK